MENNLKKFETITLGGGCFWCLEAVFNQLRGILKCESGYSGGQTANPTYESVCTGQTGHAEVVQLQFDPTLISFEQLLTVFFATHNPTTLNRQGHDVGTQYRSVIYWHTEQQQQIGQQFIKTLTERCIFSNPIVTELAPLSNYYPAEPFHQGYFDNHPNQPYCQHVIASKVFKVKSEFTSLLRPSV